jgi:hypothetical protein
MAVGLADGSKRTEVRSKSMESTQHSQLLNLGDRKVQPGDWLWFARTKVCRGVGNSDYPVIYGGAWYTGESGPVDPTQRKVVDTLAEWGSLWPDDFRGVTDLIHSFATNAPGYKKNLVGWHFEGNVAFPEHRRVRMANSNQVAGIFAFEPISATDLFPLPRRVRRIDPAKTRRSRTPASTPHTCVDPARSHRSRALASIPHTCVYLAHLHRSRSLASNPQTCVL